MNILLPIFPEYSWIACISIAFVCMAFAITGIFMLSSKRPQSIRLAGLLLALLPVSMIGLNIITFQIHCNRQTHPTTTFEVKHVSR